MDKKEALEKIAEELATAKAALLRAADAAKIAGVGFTVPAPGTHYFVPVPAELVARHRELERKAELTPEEQKEWDELDNKFESEYYRPYAMREGYGRTDAYQWGGWWENSNC